MINYKQHLSKIITDVVIDYYRQKDFNTLHSILDKLKSKNKNEVFIKYCIEAVLRERSIKDNINV
ncbi:hypothetical protein M0R19_05515 [Candidatus Pacearchaeota archaeon]|jgi:thioredoxin reductase|nr:hypothetical protein [Candidatus Pacearchaeota archaeon]